MIMLDPRDRFQHVRQRGAFSLGIGVVYVAAVSLSLGLSYSAGAQTFSGAYYCVTEFAGGLSYDESRKVWSGARLQIVSKLVLRLRYEGTINQKDAMSDALWESYTVTLASEGDPRAVLCTNDFDHPSKTVLVGGYGHVSCTSDLTLYRFNLRNSRFLAAYLRGFVDNSNEHTPGVAGGWCTKIETVKPE